MTSASPLGACLQAAKLQLVSQLTYRLDVLIELATNLLLMAAAVFLWLAAYRGVAGTPAGLAREQMVAYAIVSTCLGALFQPSVQAVVHRRVRLGEIATDLARPINPLALWLADDLGALGGRALVQLPPLVVAGLSGLVVLPWPGVRTALLFVVSCVFSFSVLWLLSALSGLVAFWTVDLGNLGYVKDAVVRALSGSLVPLWFFPPPVQAVSAWLPFQYTYQTPLGIFVGRLNSQAALSQVLLQCVWALTLALAVAALWTRGRRRVLVQGG